MISTTGFDIDKILDQPQLNGEIEYEEALQLDKQLRKLVRTNPELAEKRIKLRELIHKYEDKHWNINENVTEDRILESDTAEELVLSKSKFIKRRRELIKSRLKYHGLNQQEFGKILGHNSKSYMSELMNGISPFSLKDLIVISKLLKIELGELIFDQISIEEKKKIANNIQALNRPELTLDKTNFELI